jgi:DNA-directed RNA polymerase specialized sigma24 family protein
MSPLSLRRHRAERLLRDRFCGLRADVLASVRGRLRAMGASVEEADLEACYAQAWQGLYTAVLEGREIANPAGWLVLVTFRRAIDEHRARARAGCGEALPLDGPSGAERDLADELDDRARLRQLFEGLRGRLDEREREAATLCYLQGLSRAQAAARMGLSEARMRKLMEGRGPGRPGVAGKVGALVASIRDGEWCEQQGSLMRAYAYGILDPQGERYALASMHHGDCPACRAYVVSLRGLAATLPPVLLPWGLAAGVLAGIGEGAHAGAAVGAAGGAAGGAGAGSGAAVGGAAAGGGAAGSGAGAGAQAGRGLGGALSASGAAGAGGAGAGGGWLIGAGGLGAKLGLGCVLALGVGAGCVALDGVVDGEHGHAHRHYTARAHDARPVRQAVADGYDAFDARAAITGAAARAAASSAARVGSSTASTPAAKASREFGPEQALADGAREPAAHTSRRPIARAASSAPEGGSGVASSPGSSVGSSAGSPAGAATKAEREFAPG